MKRTLSMPHSVIRPRRGVALLLVMIGLVVCSILTAGFLSSQGTSIGIVKNERDAEKCRAISQSGIEMCYWLIKHNPTWRENMSPGKWLNNVAVGAGTVTVTALDGDNTGSFSDDPTQSVILQSVATYDSRTFTLTATISPTGGGTVFRGGNFFGGQIILNNSALADSYNSTVAAYNALFPGANNILWTNSTANGAITINFPATYHGSIVAAPTAILGSILNLVGALLFGPTSTSNANEIRVAGTVIPPDIAGLTYQGAINKNGGAPQLLAPGYFDAITLNTGTPTTTVTLPTSGVYHITGNLTLNGSTKLIVNPSVNAVVMVDGNTTIAGNVTLNSGSQLTVYSGGNVTISSGTINSGGDTSKFLIMGLSTSGQIEVKGTSTVNGAVFAPQSPVLLDTGSPKLYGAVVAQSLTMQNNAQFHFDQALQNLSIDNITKGSASPGTADYNVSVASH